MIQSSDEAAVERGLPERWEQYLHWAQRFVSCDGFDESERTYKLTILSQPEPHFWKVIPAGSTK